MLTYPYVRRQSCGNDHRGCVLIQDLAGSERLSSSGAGNDKDRLKETQAINKSLSALADVVSALGKAGDNNDKTVHIPYRNSKVSSSALIHFGDVGQSGILVRRHLATLFLWSLN
jgi:hypothetical protein